VVALAPEDGGDGEEAADDFLQRAVGELARGDEAGAEREQHGADEGGDLVWVHGREGGRKIGKFGKQKAEIYFLISIF
jgi:hypothetical protein